MKRLRNILIAILIVLEVLFLLLLVFPPTVESRPLAGAIVVYLKDPSPQNKNELERQSVMVGNKRTHQSIFIAALLALNSVGLFYVARRARARVVA